jgi:hypothetical protein
VITPSTIAIRIRRVVLIPHLLVRDDVLSSGKKLDQDGSGSKVGCGSELQLTNKIELLLPAASYKLPAASFTTSGRYRLRSGHNQLHMP